MNQAFGHDPVMVREVAELLGAVPPGLVVDATVGGGGHAEALLVARPDVRVLGVDRDPAAVAAARERLDRFADRARVVPGGFERLAEIVEDVGPRGSEEGVVGVLFDLGVSSPQLDRPERGFSYWADAPLDMRMDSAQTLTAAAVVNTYSEDELARVISAYGEERLAARIAREIVHRRPLQTTGELVEAVRAAIPAPARRRGGHPARRAFQAIRMEVNRELPNLADGLDDAVHLLTPRGRVLVLAYHSLEDRIVKERFRAWSGGEARTAGGPGPLGPPKRPAARLVRILTRRPLRAGAEEVAHNPRARSARLRAAERLP